MAPSKSLTITDATSELLDEGKIQDCLQEFRSLVIGNFKIQSLRESFELHKTITTGTFILLYIIPRILNRKN